MSVTSKSMGNSGEGVDLGLEVDFGRLERVVRREGDLDKEDATRIWAVGRTHNGGLPVKEVFPDRPRTAGCGWIPLQIQQLFLNSLASHEFLFLTSLH